MGKRPCILLPLALLLLPCWSLGAERQTLDVLVLKDGMRFKGVVIEQTPGSEVRLETLSSSVLTFAWDEIEKILKEPRSEQEMSVLYIDVVLLKSGVIFKGNIVEQVPGESIRLEAANGKVIAFRDAEIWRIVKERRFTADEAAEKNEARRMETLQASLQITLSLGRGGGGSGAARESDSLRDDIARLEEEMESREAEQEAAEIVSEEEKEALATEIAAIREELESLTREAELRDRPPDPAALELAAVQEILLALLDEIVEITKGMWTDETGGVTGDYRERLPALKAGLQEIIARTVALAAPPPAEDAGAALAALKSDLQEMIGEVRDLARQRRQEDVAATRLLLESLFTAGQWKRGGNLARVESLASSLSKEDRREVYEDSRRQDQLLGFLLNLIPVVSAGSWSQGDWAGALTCLAGTLGGVGVMAAQASSTTDYDMGLWYALQQPEGMIGAGLILGAYAYQLIRPFLYTGAENTRRREVLGLTWLGGES